ncbi:hypothetical protein [Streptomyces sp. AC495_CC817]|uniref:hypothetical protein n=1 Tax=Streptomyces sp. AC495_CC817 TaxID=2823900 RepID=UPI001C26A2A2|nr:hypothetical protein [Streptomyces sp. AC495_CC817]
MSTDFPLRGAAPDETRPTEQDGVENVDVLDGDEVFDDDGVLYDDEVTPEYGILGFTLRELLIVGAWALLFAVSFFPLGWSSAIWAQGISWVLPVGVPTVAVFLIVLRRFSPDGIRRVGSLGIDQFASVAFSVAAVWWAQQLWEYVSVLLTTGLGAVVWVPWVALVLSLALVVLTVFAPLVPGLAEDFHGRLVTLAHRNANPVRPVIARPRPEPVAAPASGTESGHVSVPAVPTASEQTSKPFVAPGAEAPVAEPAITASTVVVPELDVELSGQQATDEVARLDLADHVPLSAHASGGGTGTEEATADEEYTPVYSRRSRGQEIVSDTASIEELVLPPAGDDVDDRDIDDRDPDDRDPDDVEATRPREAVAPRVAAPEQAQPFWILAPTERDVHDERGDVLFRIGPSAWALVIEDRGGAFVIRHDDGRIGYLHDISDITKG